MKMKFRILVTYEKLSIDEEGNAFYAIKQNWVYDRNAQKVANFKEFSTILSLIAI